ncbi:MAG: acetyl-CoA carboxylase biotin carboxyl carrier protein subunit [Fidelibacterota bacterium]
MKFRAHSEGKSFTFSLHQNENSIVLETDDNKLTLDIAQITSNSYSILFEGNSYQASVEGSAEKYQVKIDRYFYQINLADETQLEWEEIGTVKENNHSGRLHAPIPGLVSSILVTERQEVKEGEQLMIIEAMKMENEIIAPVTGLISDIVVELGSTVEKDELLLIIERKK